MPFVIATYMTVGIALGLLVGLPLGEFVLDDPLLGVGAGLALGAALGTALCLAVREDP